MHTTLTTSMHIIHVYDAKKARVAIARNSVVPAELWYPPAEDDLREIRDHIRAFLWRDEDALCQLIDCGVLEPAELTVVLDADVQTCARVSGDLARATGPAFRAYVTCATKARPPGMYRKAPSVGELHNPYLYPPWLRARVRAVANL